MRSINLIPAEQRRGAGGLAGRAGGASYVVVGALAVFVLMGGVLRDRDRPGVVSLVEALAGHDADGEHADPGRGARARTSSSRRSASSASRRSRRSPPSRFDWSDAMDQIARSLPSRRDALVDEPVPAAPAAVPTCRRPRRP